MAINRNTFIHDGLKVWYKHARTKASAKLARDKGMSDVFYADEENRKWIESHRKDSPEKFVAACREYDKKHPGAMAYYNATEAERSLASFEVTIKALEEHAKLTPEMYEIILEDFRGRTSVPLEGGGRVSLAEYIYNHGGEDAIPYDMTTFNGRMSFGEVLLTGVTKKSKLGVLAPKNPKSIDDYKTDEEMIELAQAIAIVDYNNEIREKELKREEERASQMNEIPSLNVALQGAINEDGSVDEEALREITASYLAPLTELERYLSLEVLTEIKDAVKAADEKLAEADYFLPEIGVDANHLTGSVQKDFEEIYNSLFGMSTLRDRNPEDVVTYGPLSRIVVNEIAKMASTETGVSEEWLTQLKANPLFPKGFVDRAVYHAQGLLETKNEFARVYTSQQVQVGDNVVNVPVIVSPDRVQEQIAGCEHVRNYSRMMQDAIVQYFLFTPPVKDAEGNPIIPVDADKRAKFASLSAPEREAVAQLIAREMTSKAYEGSVAEAIHADLATRVLPASMMGLIEHGNFPEFSDLNEFAMSLMLVGKDKDLTPNALALQGVYSLIHTRQEAVAKYERDSFMGIYIAGQPEELRDELRARYADPEQAEVFAAEAGFREEAYKFNMPITDVVEGEVKELPIRDESGKVIDYSKDPRFVDQFGSGFYQSEVFGTYGVVEQMQIAKEHKKVQERVDKVTAEALVPDHDGYKYKFLTQSDYYKQMYNKYYQMYSGNGGATAYWGNMMSEFGNRLVKQLAPTPVQEQGQGDDGKGQGDGDDGKGQGDGDDGKGQGDGDDGKGQGDDDDGKGQGDGDDGKGQGDDDDGKGQGDGDDGKGQGDDDDGKGQGDGDDGKGQGDDDDGKGQGDGGNSGDNKSQVKLQGAAMNKRLEALYNYNAEMVAIFGGDRITRQRLAANKKGVGIARTQTETQRNMELSTAEFILKQAESCQTTEDLARLNAMLARTVESERTTKAGVNAVEVDRKTSCSVSIDHRGVRSVNINGVTYQHQTVCAIGEEPRDVIVRGYDLDHADQLAEAELISAITNPNLDERVRSTIIQANIERLKQYNGGVLLAPEDKLSFISVVPNGEATTIVPATTEQINNMPNGGNISDPTALTEHQHRDIIKGFKGPERLGTTTEVANHSVGSVTDAEITLS